MDDDKDEDEWSGPGGDLELRVMAQHVQYEWNMLNQTADLLADLAGRGFPTQGKAEGLPTGLRSAILESFAIHARTLIEFLFRPNKRDVNLAHYSPTWSDSADRTEGYKRWARCFDRASQEISHLSFQRWRGKTEEHPDAFLWDVPSIREKLNREMEHAIGVVPGLHKPLPGAMDWGTIAARKTGHVPPVAPARTS